MIGGETKQYQVLVDPAKLRDYNLTLKQVMESVGAANANSSGGFLERPAEEYLIRARGRVNTLVIQMEKESIKLVQAIDRTQVTRPLAAHETVDEDEAA